jgi:hypothetical protein
MKFTKGTLKRPTWFDNRFALILAVIVLLIAAGARWNRPLPPEPSSAAPEPALAGAVLPPGPGFPQLDETPSPDATPVQPSRTPYPPELLSNRQQTIGISLVAALLVLIVSGGVFSVFLRDRDSG